MYRKRVVVILVLVFTVTMALLLSGCTMSQKSTQEAVDTIKENPNVKQQINNKKLITKDIELLPEDIKRIKKKGKLVVAMFWQDRPPFFYKNKQGELVGIDVTLARDIAESLGVEVEFDRSAKSFDEVVDQVVMGKADVAISKLSVTLSRAQRTGYTEPYVVFHQALLVNRLGLSDIESRVGGGDVLPHLFNTRKKIGVRATTSYEEYAKVLFPQAEIVTFENMEDLIEAVRDERVLAAFYDENELKTFINKSPELSVYAKLFILEDRVDPIAIAVAHHDQALLAWLNIYLDVRKNSLSIEKILSEYRGGT